ncbi:MAG TPA: hypothetical protein VFA17_00520, partial [Thermoplasmata archaeon]|nr:hypothetical protein [Thermoplasmata archaeon]
SPFLMAFWRVPKGPFLIAPVVAFFLLYPIGAPHGIVYGRDDVFNFAFTNQVATTGFWIPGGVSGLAQTYTLYPLGNVFQAYLIRTAEWPAPVAFLWVEVVVRMIVMPPAVYAIGRRIFGPQVGVLSVFVYMGTASILMNVPVQQGMGTIFVALSLLALLILNDLPAGQSHREARTLFAVVAGSIVMTHHLSSYIFALWLIGLWFMTNIHRLRRRALAFRLSPLALYFLVLLGFWIATVSYRVFQVHEQSFEAVVQRLSSPESLPTATTPRLGRTFSFVEIVWLGSAVLGILGLAWIGVLTYRRSRIHAFAVANAIVAIVLALATIPMIATGAEFVPLRIGEYSNLIVGPFAAATLFRWSQSGVERWRRLVPARMATSVDRVVEWVPIGGAIVLSSLLFMGGSLVPQALRLYFETPDQWNTDTPLLEGSDFIRMADWGHDQFDSLRVWGDHMSIDIFSGFGNGRVYFGSSAIFKNSTFDWCQPVDDPAAPKALSVGDLVAVEHRMTKYPSQWFLELEPEVRVPLTAAQVGKFATDPHFALIYDDGTFSIYIVLTRPRIFCPP